MERKLFFLVMLLASLIACPLSAQKPEQPLTPGKVRPGQNRPKQDERAGVKRWETMNVLEGLTEQLDLDDDQVAEVRLIVRDFTEQLRQQAEAGASEQGNQSAAKRQKLLERFKNQGLQGQELKTAVQEALGGSKPAEGGRLRDQLVQRQADLISKVREVLNEEQQEKLDELLRQRAEELRAKREAGAAKRGTSEGNSDGKGQPNANSDKKRKKGST